MKTTYLIDGNNVIHKIASLHKQFLLNPDFAARALVEICKSKLNKKVNIILVFDGYGKSYSKSIVFSGDKSADKIICNFIEANYLKEQIIVVSSDREILSKAKICGCKIISSGQFSKEILKEPVKGQDKPDRITQKEFEEFLEYFK
ncbi:MAG: NYN domain-containing protein [Ignavibacteria bacterium]